MKYIAIIFSLLFLVGCAKHGVYMETGKDYKGNFSAGWGPMSIIEQDAAGSIKLCIPSKEALELDPKDNWCRQWMERPIVE